jgi:hypothetical protein
VKISEKSPDESSQKGRSFKPQDNQLQSTTKETTKPPITGPTIPLFRSLEIDFRGIQIQILSATTKYSGPKSWTVKLYNQYQLLQDYEIKSDLGPHSWKIYRRYSKFHSLHSQVQ